MWWRKTVCQICGFLALIVGPIAINTPALAATNAHSDVGQDRSASKTLGFAVTDALNTTGAGEVLDLSQGRIHGTPVWDIRVRTPQGLYLVSVNQQSEHVVAMHKVY
ncbi:MAG: hypothetical protein C7B46_18355 [Sulfobacillus benefaciens]|uniref:PepSY domain-containing protein n=1 Tax=Sulfobacillus benefaciens TaxID=453960 RepID=A0A2T2X5D7_9FIRM|nr:MAG: hypothetical protein C7B46_18355 [Sulfobacillus benefaciens]